jgi:hypothetical protein
MSVKGYCSEEPIREVVRFCGRIGKCAPAERADVQGLRQRVTVKLGLPKAFRAQGAQSSVLGRGCRSDLYRRMGSYALRIAASLARAKAPR